MHRTAIIREILTRMDEILPPGETISHPFESYMNSVLDEAYRTVLKEYPIHLLDLSDIISGGMKAPGSAWSGLTTGLIYMASANGTGGLSTVVKGDIVLATGAIAATVLDVYDTTNKIAYIPAPDNYERLGQFKFTGWSNPAKKHITTESPEYKYIENGAIAGGKVNPVVVLTHGKRSTDSTIKKYLVCYDVAVKDDTAKLWYVKYDKDSGLESLNDNAIPGLVWKSCSLLMQIFALPEMKVAEERYQAFLLSNS